MPITTDPEWTEAAKRSEKRRLKDKVYRAVEDHHRNSLSQLIGLAYTSLQNHADAEEAVQDAYVRALSYWGSYDYELGMQKWYLQILRNCIANKWNEINRDGMVVEYDAKKDNRLANESGLSRYQQSFIMETISDLPDSHKRVIELYLHHGMTRLEISELVPENVRNVDKIIERFTDNLKGEGLEEE